MVPLCWYRDTGLTALMKRTRGIGRVCLDFMDVCLTPGAGSGGVGSELTIYNRWPHSSCAARAEPQADGLGHPDGPATTLRYEAFCEGIQFAQAMIVVSEAVETREAVLGQERSDTFRRLLVDLVRHEIKCRGGQLSPLRPNHEGLAGPCPATVRRGSRGEQE